MIKQIRPALFLFIAFSLLFGLGYPVFVWGIAQTTMADKANGSLIERHGKIIGSALIAQTFASDRYFWPRPMTGTSASNLAPNNPRLQDRVRAQRAILDAVHPDQKNIPDDLLTTSGSGHDPHISLEAALFQIGRIAKARNVEANKIEALIDELLERRSLGFLGEPRVNVLELNLALDTMAGG